MAVIGVTGGLIIQNGTFVVEIGDIKVPGVAATYDDDSFNALCILRGLRYREGGTKTDVGGACSTKNVFTKPSESLSVSSVEPVDGKLWTRNGTRLFGRSIRITRKDLSTMTDPEVYVGVIESYDWSAAEGSANMEDVVIDLNPA